LNWLPALNKFNNSARSRADHVSVLDPSNSQITRLAVSGFTDPRGLALHGMDVVTSAENPNELFVYLVNHRPKLNESEFGEDPSIEIFKTVVGGNEMHHVKTLHAPGVLKSPNDVVGSANGKEFWFTNDMTDLQGWKVRGTETGAGVEAWLMDWMLDSVVHVHGSRRDFCRLLPR
jgi:arylesterase/paraoxonase